jgi:hypothetical protein
MSAPIELSATVVCEAFEERPAEVDLTFGGDELVVESADRSLSIDRSAVFDVRIGSSPQVTAEFFTGTTLMVGYDRDDRREVLFVDGSRDTLEKHAGLLYRWLLNETEVAVRHPTEVGGRVTGEAFAIGTLRVTPGKVGCTGIEHPFGIDLEAIVHLSRSETELLGERRRVITTQYVRNGTAVTFDLSVNPARKQHLLGRHLRLKYDEIRRAIRQLSVPTQAVRTLYELYSLRGTATPASLFEGTADASPEVVRGLEQAGLVCRHEDRIALTSRGWILVTTRVDADAATSDDRATGEDRPSHG